MLHNKLFLMVYQIGKPGSSGMQECVTIELPWLIKKAISTPIQFSEFVELLIHKIKPLRRLNKTCQLHELKCLKGEEQ